jgi:nitroreductase
MKSNLISIVLLLALIVVSGQLYSQTSKKDMEKTSSSSSQSVIDNILTRASVRAYQDRKVEKDKIDTLLRAGMAAPTAMDRRPWHFVVITTKDKLQQLAEATPNAGMAADAPLAIVVCGDMDKAIEGRGRDFWIQDCSAATENILLAAHGMGLGAVWTGTYPSEERCKAVSQLLGLKSNLVPLCTVVIGYPKQKVEPKDKWDADNVTWM